MTLTRNTWFNAGLIALAAASVVVVVTTRDATRPSDGEGQTQRVFPQFRPADVTRFELHLDRQAVTIERAEDADGTATYRLIEPVKELADAAAVDKFLTALADARALRKVDQGPAASVFGLDEPRVQIVLHTVKQTHRLALGGAAPTPSGAHYARFSTDQAAPSIVVVAQSLFDDLATDLDSFRLRTLTEISEADVTRIEIDAPSGPIVLRRSTPKNFVIDGQPQLLANREVVKSLFFQLSRLSSSRFLSTSEATVALGASPAHFVFETRDPKQTLSFDAGGSCPGDPSKLVIVRHSPSAQSGCATRELDRTLELARDDFADRRAFSLHVDEVEELDLSSPKGKFSLVRKGTGFVLHTGSETPVELEAGNQRILALLEASGERILQPNLGDLGLEAGGSTVTMRSSAARDSEVTVQVVRVGNRDADGNLAVYREQDRTALRVPGPQARAFALDSTLLYARKLTEFGLSSFLSAEIERASERQVLRRAPSQELQLDAPPGFSPDGVLSSDLIQTLGALTAERFVADRDDGTFGLVHSRLAVRFAYKNADGSKSERRLRFGDETALGVFATLGDDGPVFVLPRTVRETCDTLLINRAVFPSGPDELIRLTLEAHGRSLTLARQGDRLAVVQPSAVPPEKAQALSEAWADLRPEAGLHTGPARPEEGFSKPTLTLHLSPAIGKAQTLTFGAGDSFRGTSVFYLRVSGVDATFVVAQSKVRALRDAL